MKSKLIPVFVSIIFILAGCGTTANLNESELVSTETMESVKGETEEINVETSQSEEIVEEITIDKSSEFKLEQVKPINKFYTEYDGKIYYRQYSAEDKVSGELFGGYGDVIEVTEKDLMCMDDSGNVNKVGTDNGIGALVIVDGKLYSQKRNNGFINQVYSCDLSGENEKTYESSDVVGLIGDSIICTAPQKGIYVIDTKSQEEKLLSDTANEYLFAANDSIFYVENDENGSAIIYSVTLNGEISKIVEVTTEDLEKYTGSVAFLVKITCTQTANNKIYFSAGSYGGSTNMYQGGIIASVNADGTDFEIVDEFATDKFYVLEDSSLTITEGDKVREPYFSDSSDVCIIRDTNSSEEILMSKSEYEGLGLGGLDDYIDETYWAMSEMELVGDKFFFTISTGTHDASQDIGWRTYYTRDVSSVFCKNMTTGDITMLYTY